jgi:hypothetical protein
MGFVIFAIIYLVIGFFLMLFIETVTNGGLGFLDVAIVLLGPTVIVLMLLFFGFGYLYDLTKKGCIAFKDVLRSYK